MVQGERTKLFDEIVNYNSDDLKENPQWECHQDFSEAFPKRHGLGIWKPFLIKHEMSCMEDGDRLLYVDAGCEFDLDCENLDEEYKDLCEQLNTVKILSTISKSFRNDVIYDDNVIDYMKFKDDDLICNPPLEAKTVLIENNIETREIIQKWYDLCVDFYKTMDIKKINENIHYEESIWSLLLKKNGLYNMLVYEFSLNRILCISKYTIITLR